MPCLAERDSGILHESPLLCDLQRNFSAKNVFFPGQRGGDWPKHMFGARNLDWSEIIPRMFSPERRLEKLELGSHYAAEFLSLEDQAALRAVRLIFDSMFSQYGYYIMR